VGLPVRVIRVRIIVQDPLNYCPTKLISRRKNLNWYLSKAIELAYRFLVFCRYFLAWKVGKIERGGRGRHGRESEVWESLKMR
jgi:hypothetical protein